MRILVIDGQGGNMGRQLIKSITDRFPDARIHAVGTNSAATANMLKNSGITAATGKEGQLNYSHTAIAEVEDGRVWIIDATLKRGVDRYPLDTFLTDFTLKDGSYPVFEVMRIKDGPRGMVENAKKHLGEPYDSNFLPDNGASYCTELVRDSYLDASGKPILPAAPMNFKGPDGEFPPYWEQLFGRLGVPIPQDVPGTNPQDMYSCPVLEKVDIDITALRQ